MRFSRQEYWNVLPFPSPGELPDLGIESGTPALKADSLPTELQVKPCLPTTSLSILYQFHCIRDILVLHRGTQEILAVLYWCLSWVSLRLQKALAGVGAQERSRAWDPHCSGIGIRERTQGRHGTSVRAWTQRTEKESKIWTCWEYKSNVPKASSVSDTLW